MDEIEYYRQVLKEKGLVEDSIRRGLSSKINIFTMLWTIFVLFLQVFIFIPALLVKGPVALLTYLMAEKKRKFDIKKYECYTKRMDVIPSFIFVYGNGFFMLYSIVELIVITFLVDCASWIAKVLVSFALFVVW